MKAKLGFWVGACLKFRLLMWKNLLQQWRHRKQTSIELLLPVLIMTVILLLRWLVEPSQSDQITYPPLPAYTLAFSAPVITTMTNFSIAYSPASPVLEDVLRSAMSNLVLENLEDLIPTLPPDISRNSNTKIIEEIISSFIRIEAFNSSGQMNGLYLSQENIQTFITAVEFDDKLYGAVQLPNDLSYALRFPERPRSNTFNQFGSTSWRTESVFPTYELPGPRNSWSPHGGDDPGYVTEMFIAIQHAISSELVSRVTQLDLQSYKVYIQRYPHPSYVIDLAMDLLQLIFPTFIMLSFSYTAVNIVRAVTTEKESQLKEIMKIMGLPTWLHWTAWFCKQFSFQLVAAILIVVLLKVPWFTNTTDTINYAVFTNTPWTILLFFTMLYLTSMIFFCFMISGLFSKARTAALVTGVVWFVSYIPAIVFTMDVETPFAAQVITCFSFNAAMAYGFLLIIAAESSGGLQWGSLLSFSTQDTSRLLFGHVVIMLVVDCVLYMLITLYLEQVLPGPFGAPKPWYFPFQPQFWCCKKNSDTAILYKDSDNCNIGVVKEKDPENHTTGVKMHNLTKVYGNNTVVNSLTMNIYDNQITVLLGHNGAGKSTTISMLTGNLGVTSGTINVAGYDISTQASAARAHIGLCPQHNVLFTELTVKEHLEFFARLKGLTGANLNNDIENLIGKLELQDKSNCPSKALSGGQKRRLCVGIALCGAAKVVLLDEPSSGMDPAARRKLWELLQKEKEGRSLILTTHFMDEADVLGDRVAIMAHGSLKCVGSPYFLKRYYGVGYTLVVVKDEGFDCIKCTSLINEYIPDTIVKEDRGSEVTYSLLAEFSNVFENMLSDLERNAKVIKFKNYGLVATTLEDVFMTVGSDLGPVNDNSNGTVIAGDPVSRGIDSSLEQMTKEENSVKGFTLLVQQMLGVWLKLGLVWLRSWLMVLLQLFVPILIVTLTLGVMEYAMSITSTFRRRQLSPLDGYGNTETLLSYNGTLTSDLGSLAVSAYQAMFELSGAQSLKLTNVGGQHIEDYYLNRTQDPKNMAVLRNQLIIGATFSDESATAWFSNFGYHDVAISLSAVHSALLKSANPSASLSVSNYPLPATYEEQLDLQTMISMLSTQIGSAVGNSISVISAVFVMFYIKERVSGAKLLQNASGVQPLVLWVSAAIFDWTWFLVTCISIAVSFAAFQVIGLSTAEELGRFYLCVMIYGAAMLPLTYILSLLFKKPAVGFACYYIINVIVGTIGPQIVDLLSGPLLESEDAANILDLCLQFLPLYSFVTIVRNFNEIALQEQLCLQLCGQLLPEFDCINLQPLCEINPACCVSEGTYFQWEAPGVLRYIVCMIASCLVFWIVLMVIEYRLYQKVFLCTRKPPPINVSSQDDDVAAEEKQVQQLSPSNYSDQTLLVNKLSKYYGKNLAVDQVSFRVNSGECFGLLGVNGAGKTTTFKMLMGDESISNGKAYICGHSVQKNLFKVYEHIGYCPQFDALFNELTGRETLRVFALMRGLRRDLAADLAVSLAQALGFFDHLDKRVHQYSGGTKRKLNTAVAFLGKTQLMFADEPTTGLDPAAKRHVWHALRGMQRSGRSSVLTSHSMEECEALCTRLTIMVKGQFKCLGTPQHLKNKFSQGFTLIIKLKSEDVLRSQNSLTSDTNQMAVKTSVVKDYINANFNNSRIMEEYDGLLTYYLTASMPWSRMFGIMERAKRDFGVEDYTISQTTLEQIFLQFTKYQANLEESTVVHINKDPVCR